MADNYLITGYWGEPHVTAENDRGLHAATFGKGRFVLPVGQQFHAEFIGNNTVRMYDGKLMNNGAAAGITAGEHVDLLISDASQGMKRNDLIIFQYEQDAYTLIERGTFIVIQGTESSGTAADPALTQEDLLSGKASLDQFALWRVSVSGSAISAPEQLFTVSSDMQMMAKAFDDSLKAHKDDKKNPHAVTKEQVGLGNVPNVATNDQTPTFTTASTLAALVSGEKLSVAFGKIAKAIKDLISHLANKNNPHGVTAAQVGADPTGTAASAVSTHNTATNAHNDIRLLIEGLTTRLNALANSDDTTLDQMAEVVAYIKANRDLIDQITTGKVSVSDIVNNLTTNVSNKPLSAAQGVALKALIDAIKVPTKASDIGLSTETWTFTLESGSTVTKAVYVG